ncbi:MAG: hypothetical protein QXZ13_00030 [Candidatus Diapherotrites archaeon]
MHRLSLLQKKIGFQLVSSPKSPEEISRLLGVSIAEVNSALKEMLKLGLVKVEGYPQKYFLAPEILERVKARKEISEKDPFELRLKAIIEFKAVEETFLFKNMSEIESKLRAEKDFTIYDIFKAKPLQSGVHFSSYLEVNFSIKDFTKIIYFMYFYGPTSVEVIKPNKIVIAMDDLQDALMYMAEMIQSYNEAMLKYIAKEELEDFAKSLYQPKD